MAVPDVVLSYRPIFEPTPDSLEDAIQRIEALEKQVERLVNGDGGRPLDEFIEYQIGRYMKKNRIATL